MYSVVILFILFILLLLSDLPPIASLGHITRTAKHISPETLLTVPDAFPAGLIVCDPSSFIEKKGQFLFSLLTHSRHRHSSFLPSRRCRLQDSKIWSRFGIIFCIFCSSNWAFLASNIIGQGLSHLMVKNAVWSYFGIILEQFVRTTLRSGRIRIVPVLFFPWILLLSFFLLRSNITNGRADSPAGIFLLCCVSLSSGRQYLTKWQIIEGMGNRNPKQEHYSGIHDCVLRSGSCS